MPAARFVKRAGLVPSLLLPATLFAQDGALERAARTMGASDLKSLRYSNLERLDLKVDRILPLHGRIVPVRELYTAAGARAP